MTNDRGAEARVFEPGQRRTLFVPLFEGTSIDVYVDGCERIAHIDWLPGRLPSTIVLSNDPQGAGYVIDIQPGVSGTPVPESTFDFPPCSG